MRKHNAPKHTVQLSSILFNLLYFVIHVVYDFTVANQGHSERFKCLTHLILSCSKALLGSFPFGSYLSDGVQIRRSNPQHAGSSNFCLLLSATILVAPLGFGTELELGSSALSTNEYLSRYQLIRPLISSRQGPSQGTIIWAGWTLVFLTKSARLHVFLFHLCLGPAMAEFVVASAGYLFSWFRLSCPQSCSESKKR